MPLSSSVTAVVKLPSKSDRNGYERLFRSYYPRLLAYAELFTDRAAAEDIVQELMIHLWDQCENISIHCSLEAYLFRSVYRRCLNRINHEKVAMAYRQRSAFLHEDEERNYDPENNPVILKLFSSELKTEIENAIASLPVKCRQAFIASYIDGLSAREIAETLGISERTAETHIYHALKHLRLKLKAEYLIMLLWI